MQTEFEENLSQEQKDEMKAREDFEELSASKNAQTTAGKAKLDEMEVAHADNTKALSDAKEDLETTYGIRGADVEFLMNLRVTCQGLDKEWAERTATRAQELQAVAEALAVLTEDDNRDHLAKTVTFLQEASDTEMRARLSRAAAFLRKVAREPNFDDMLDAWQNRGSLPQHQSPRSQLATLAVGASLDGFAQVKAAMDKMVQDLNDQQAEEVQAKARCVSEFDENEKTTFKKNGEKDDLEATLDSLASAISNLEKEISVGKETLGDSQVAIKKAGESREKENAEFQTVVADQRATQTILKKALGKLEDFYKKKQSLLQATQEPPVKFTKYKKSAGGNSVIGLIEQIVEDSVKLEGEATDAERQAQTDYESFVKDTNAIIHDLQTGILTKTKQIAAAQADSEEAKSSLTSTGAELESLGEYKADLHGQCDFLLKNFAIRQRARTQEMEAINQAKAILAGAMQ